MDRLSVSASMLAALCGAIAAPANAWGPIGHRVSADLAERNISGHARAHVELILEGETLREGSTQPDEQRPNPDPFWQESAPWHYVTLPPGLTIEDLQHPPGGDAVTALEGFVATLRDPAAARADKARALRFVVHLVSDLHLPLHVGNGLDRGGNDFRVIWFGEPQTLHWVWDEGLINRKQLSSAEYAERLSARTQPVEVLAWWDARPETWLAESAALRERTYPVTGRDAGEGTVQSPVALSYEYEYEWTPAMELRLRQSGYRLAAYLDWVFREQPAS